jgi:hypothetical protein
MAAATALCLVLTALVAVVARTIFYSIAIAAAAFCALHILGAHGPQAWRLIAFVPQVPGFFATIIALGVHGDEQLTASWTVSINTILYAPMIHAIVQRRAERVAL